MERVLRNLEGVFGGYESQNERRLGQVPDGRTEKIDNVFLRGNSVRYVVLPVVERRPCLLKFSP